MTSNNLQTGFDDFVEDFKVRFRKGWSDTQRQLAMVPAKFRRKQSVKDFVLSTLIAGHSSCLYAITSAGSRLYNELPPEHKQAFEMYRRATMKAYQLGCSEALSHIGATDMVRDALAHAASVQCAVSTFHKGE